MQDLHGQRLKLGGQELVLVVRFVDDEHAGSERRYGAHAVASLRVPITVSSFVFVVF
jgi:hypothetical protein